MIAVVAGAGLAGLSVLLFAGSIRMPPLVLAIGLIPISVNGLGVLEAGYVWVLVTLGMSPAEAISVALIIRGRLVLHALVGGLIFLVYRGLSLARRAG